MTGLDPKLGTKRNGVTESIKSLESKTSKLLDIHEANSPYHGEHQARFKYDDTVEYLSTFSVGSDNLQNLWEGTIDYKFQSTDARVTSIINQFKDIEFETNDINVDLVQNIIELLELKKSSDEDWVGSDGGGLGVPYADTLEYLAIGSPYHGPQAHAWLSKDNLSLSDYVDKMSTDLLGVMDSGPALNFDLEILNAFDDIAHLVHDGDNVFNRKSDSDPIQASYFKDGEKLEMMPVDENGRVDYADDAERYSQFKKLLGVDSPTLELIGNPIQAYINEHSEFYAMTPEERMSVGRPPSFMIGTISGDGVLTPFDPATNPPVDVQDLFGTGSSFESQLVTYLHSYLYDSLDTDLGNKRINFPDNEIALDIKLDKYIDKEYSDSGQVTNEVPQTEEFLADHIDKFNGDNQFNKLVDFYLNQFHQSSPRYIEDNRTLFDLFAGDVNGTAHDNHNVNSLLFSSVGQTLNRLETQALNMLESGYDKVADDALMIDLQERMVLRADDLNEEGSPVEGKDLDVRDLYDLLNKLLDPSSGFAEKDSEDSAKAHRYKVLKDLTSSEKYFGMADKIESDSSEKKGLVKNDFNWGTVDIVAGDINDSPIMTDFLDEHPNTEGLDDFEKADYLINLLDKTSVGVANAHSAVYASQNLEASQMNARQDLRKLPEPKSDGSVPLDDNVNTMYISATINSMTIAGVGKMIADKAKANASSKIIQLESDGENGYQLVDSDAVGAKHFEKFNNIFGSLNNLDGESYSFDDRVNDLNQSIKDATKELIQEFMDADSTEYPVGTDDDGNDISLTMGEMREYFDDLVGQMSDDSSLDTPENRAILANITYQLHHYTKNIIENGVTANINGNDMNFTDHLGNLQDYYPELAENMDRLDGTSDGEIQIGGTFDNLAHSAQLLFTKTNSAVNPRPQGLMHQYRADMTMMQEIRLAGLSGGEANYADGLKNIYSKALDVPDDVMSIPGFPAVPNITGGDSFNSLGTIQTFLEDAAEFYDEAVKTDTLSDEDKEKIDAWVFGTSFSKSYTGSLTAKTALIVDAQMLGHYTSATDSTNLNNLMKDSHDALEQKYELTVQQNDYVSSLKSLLSSISPSTIGTDAADLRTFIEEIDVSEVHKNYQIGDSDNFNLEQDPEVANFKSELYSLLDAAEAAQNDGDSAQLVDISRQVRRHIKNGPGGIRYIKDQQDTMEENSTLEEAASFMDVSFSSIIDANKTSLADKSIREQMIVLYILQMFEESRWEYEQWMNDQSRFV